MLRKVLVIVRSHGVRGLVARASAAMRRLPYTSPPPPSKRRHDLRTYHLGRRVPPFKKAAPPLPVDDDRYEKFFGHRTSADARYGRFRLLNGLMAGLAADVGARFIDLWEATTQNGLLDPQYYLDGFHLNMKAATLTVCTVIANLSTAGAG